MGSINRTPRRGRNVSKVKRQHYVPQFLLKNFVDEQGKLSVYLRGEGLARQARPDGMAFHRYYNAAKNETGEIDTPTVEKELSQIEGAGSAVVQRLLNGATISYEDRDWSCHAFVPLQVLV